MTNPAGSKSDRNGRPVGVGLLGCGWIAGIAHIPSLTRSDAGRLVAAADTNGERQTWLAAHAPTARFHGTWEALLQDPDVEAVVVALPTALHADAACRAFDAGKHVFLEKPLAVNLDEGRRVLDAWRRAGTVGAIGYNFRRNPIVEAAARDIASGALGPLIAIHGSFHWAAERAEGWRAHPEQGGGVLLDLVSHHVDLVSALTAERVTQVQCMLRSLRSTDDTAAVQLTTSGGVIAQLQASFAAGAQINRLDLVGRQGALSVDLLSARPRRIQRVPGRGARVVRALTALEELHPSRLLHAPGDEPSFQVTLENFLVGARNGSDVSPSLADGFHALAVIEAASVSARTGGRMVPVESGT